jgi:hypothetical protein
MLDNRPHLDSRIRHEAGSRRQFQLLGSIGKAIGANRSTARFQSMVAPQHQHELNPHSARKRALGRFHEQCNHVIDKLERSWPLSCATTSSSSRLMRWRSARLNRLHTAPTRSGFSAASVGPLRAERVSVDGASRTRMAGEVMSCPTSFETSDLPSFPPRRFPRRAP